jgi:hypothetical protein
VIVVVAGMDGALPAVVAGLGPAPVVAVPTSTGYGGPSCWSTPLIVRDGAVARHRKRANVPTGPAVIDPSNGF